MEIKDKEMEEIESEKTQSNLPLEPIKNYDSRKQKIIYCLVGMVGIIILLSICLIKLM